MPQKVISVLWTALSALLEVIKIANDPIIIRGVSRTLVVVVVVYFILSRLLYLAFSANLGLLCMPHPGMGPLV